MLGQAHKATWKEGPGQPHWTDCSLSWKPWVLPQGLSRGRDGTSPDNPSFHLVTAEPLSCAFLGLGCEGGTEKFTGMQST